jgi:hypothetical protein
MLPATTAFRELCFEMPKKLETFDVPGLSNLMKQNPALYAGCRTYKEYHGLAGEMGMRLRLFELAKDPRFDIAPCIGDYQPYFGDSSGDCAENFGRVYLSGSGIYTRTREYDSVILLRGSAFVLESTIAYQRALDKTDPADIERHLDILKKRLGRDFGFAIVTMSNKPGLTYSSRSRIRDFEKRGGVFVTIPLSIRDFCDEVDYQVRKAGFPIYGSIQCAPAIASWEHTKTKERRNQAKSSRDREFRTHERKTLTRLEQRLGFANH